MNDLAPIDLVSNGQESICPAANAPPSTGQPLDSLAPEALEQQALAPEAPAQKIRKSKRPAAISAVVRHWAAVASATGFRRPVGPAFRNLGQRFLESEHHRRDRKSVRRRLNHSAPRDSANVRRDVWAAKRQRPIQRRGHR